MLRDMSHLEPPHLLHRKMLDDVIVRLYGPRTVRHRALMAALISAPMRAGLTQRDAEKRLSRTHSFVGTIESGRHSWYSLNKLLPH